MKPEFSGKSIRPMFTLDEAAVAVAALRYYRDSFFEGDEENGEEAAISRERADCAQDRLARALRRLGYLVDPG